MQDFTHKIAIVKADDLGRETSLDCWWRLLEPLDVRGVPLSIGVVGESIHQYARGDLTRLVAQLRRGAHEIWNHSYSHPDFARIPLVDQAEELRRSQAAIEDVFGLRPHVFGAPFNSMSAETITALEEDGDFSAVYFARFPTRLDTIPYENMCPPEYVDQFRRQPEFDEFLPRYERRKHVNPIVLQVHPPAWSQHGLNEFIRIVDLLQGLGWQFLTFDDLIGCRSWRAGDGAKLKAGRAELLIADELRARAFAEAPAAAGGHPDDRIEGIAKGTGHLLNALVRIGFDRKDSRAAESSSGLDIGCGEGNWTVAYAALSRQHRATGIDLDAHAVAVLAGAVSSLPFSQRISFQTGSVDRIPAADASFDHVICRDALNAARLEPAFNEIHRVLKRDGIAFLSVRNRNFWLKRFHEAIQAGDRAAAQRAIDRLASRSAFEAGLPADPNHASMWDSNELCLLAESVGLGVLSVDLAVGDRPEGFLGVPVSTNHTFLKTAPPARPGDRFLPAGRPDMTGLLTLYRSGAWRIFLACVERVCENTGALIFANAFERLVTASVVSATHAGDPVGPAAAVIAERHGAFGEAVDAYCRANFGRAAAGLTRLATLNPAERALVLPAMRALHAAGDPGAARRLGTSALGDQGSWSDAEWLCWLAPVIAADGVDAGRAALADYFQHRLYRLEDRTGSADLPAMMKDMGLADPPYTDLLTAAALHAAIAGLR